MDTIVRPTFVRRERLGRARIPTDYTVGYILTYTRSSDDPLIIQYTKNRGQALDDRRGTLLSSAFQSRVSICIYIGLYIYIYICYRGLYIYYIHMYARTYTNMCVCVCVCERESDALMFFT